ncbi:SIR2 family protein [Rhodobacter sp. Har01]|uniref:SIR2 family NAD-dependent protein deacylase n=1 Tax=Rhodobacter sp. Har01 TaxID=2883999 RepID=UPI001D08A37F|nr:SIR2 family protein [Rhodobacter sp. Har01]MCB6178307.1 SIR2 family protein [Rhodobacter sp. Har01]
MNAGLARALDEVARGARVPWLGPGVAALSGGGLPATPAELCARIEAEVRVPRRVSGNLWSAAQFVESRRFRATLDAIMRRAFSDGPPPNPLQRWLAAVRPPLIVDAWYDDALIRAFDGADWGWVQAISRQRIAAEVWTAVHDATGAPVAAADPAWRTLIYKPHGMVRPGSDVLVSDSDYVEVLTEIDIQTPIPDEVQNRRTGRPFLFLGTRFDDQMLRTFARQIAKRSAPGHVAVVQAPLTRMEQRFTEELGITVVDLPLQAVVDLAGQHLPA